MLKKDFLYICSRMQHVAHCIDLEVLKPTEKQWSQMRLEAISILEALNDMEVDSVPDFQVQEMVPPTGEIFELKKPEPDPYDSAMEIVKK